MKTFLLLVLVTASAFFAGGRVLSQPESTSGLMLTGALGGFGVAILTAFKKEWAQFTAPLYALLEGLFIGAASVLLEAKFHGIVFQSVCLTFGTMFALLGAYQCRIIKVNNTFRSIIVAATGGILIAYLANLVYSLFTHQSFGIIQGHGTFAILFSLAVVVVAALNLVLDFEFVETGVQMGAPKWMEWYASFGLMVTLIWLYIEILRLLAKMRSND